MEANRPKVTVIIATHNDSGHLGECLDSIVCGQMKEIEVIIADVLSMDGTKEIINEARETDPRIVFLTDGMGSIGHARNMALNYVRGEYVMFVDPNDYIARDALELLCMDLDETPDVGMRLCQTECFGALSTGWTNRERIEKKAGADKVDNRRISIDNRQFRFFAFDCAAMYRKSFLEEHDIRFYDEPGYGSQDAAFQFFAMSKLSFSMTMDILYFHRMERHIDRDERSVPDVAGEFRFLKDRLMEDPEQWWKLRFAFWQAYYNESVKLLRKLPEKRKMRLAERMQADLREAIRNKEFNPEHFDIACREEMELLMASADKFFARLKQTEEERNKFIEEKKAKQERKNEILAALDRNAFEKRMQESGSNKMMMKLDKPKLLSEMARDLCPLRMLLGFTPEEMGGLLGISASSYKSMESGKKEVSWDQYMALLFVFRFNNRTAPVADALGLNPEPLQLRYRKGLSVGYI